MGEPIPTEFEEEDSIAPNVRMNHLFSTPMPDKLSNYLTKEDNDLGRLSLISPIPILNPIQDDETDDQKEKCISQSLSQLSINQNKNITQKLKIPQKKEKTQKKKKKKKKKKK